MLKMNGWCWYFSGEEGKLNLEKCGKWMFFFQDQRKAMDICEKAIKEKVCYECKCTDMDVCKKSRCQQTAAFPFRVVFKKS